jgi:hypothetical protein
MNETATEKNLTPRQVKALASYFDTGDVSQATGAAGVNRSTFYRWVNEDPLFQAAMAEAEARALAFLAGRLVSLARKATDTIEAVLDSKTATTSQRLRAADIVLANLLRVRELVTLEQRLAALEERVR